MIHDRNGEVVSLGNAHENEGKGNAFQSPRYVHVCSTARQPLYNFFPVTCEGIYGSEPQAAELKMVNQTKMNI